MGSDWQRVGITSEIITEHRPYITAWIGNALKTGAFAEQASPASSDSEEAPHSFHESSRATDEGNQTVQDGDVESQSETVELHSDSGELVDFEHGTELDGIPIASIGLGQGLRPSDVALNALQTNHYECAHLFCQEASHERQTTLFELLLHARNYHCTHKPPWSTCLLPLTVKRRRNHLVRHVLQ